MDIVKLDKEKFRLGHTKVFFRAGILGWMEEVRLREEIKDLESTIEKCEDDKMTKDSQIRTLCDEIAHQEDLISKLGKDKKSTAESRQKTEEDIQAMEDRCNHLSKVKGKIEDENTLASKYSKQIKEVSSIGAKIEDENTLA